jgi:glycine/D-amino acid oxidase-like deaminating enzyme
MPHSPTAAVLGELGLPVPIRELTARRWDTIIVGTSHNGPACAAYLARAGQRVLVIERRARGLARGRIFRPLISWDFFQAFAADNYPLQAHN